MAKRTKAQRESIKRLLAALDTAFTEAVLAYEAGARDVFLATWLDAQRRRCRIDLGMEPGVPWGTDTGDDTEDGEARELLGKIFC